MTRRQDCTIDLGKNPKSRSQGNKGFIKNNKWLPQIRFYRFRRDSEYENHFNNQGN
jgi:hypothetical protein